MAKTRKTYTAEFKLQAVRQVIDQHLAVAEVARRLGITEGRLHDWLKAFLAQGADAFPGHGRLASNPGSALGGHRVPVAHVRHTPLHSWLTPHAVSSNPSREGTSLITVGTRQIATTSETGLTWVRGGRLECRPLKQSMTGQTRTTGGP